MFREYLAAAMKRAKYEILTDDGTYCGEIPGFQGVLANAPDLEECRNTLEEVLEEWLVFSLSRGLPIPVIDGLDLKFKGVYSASPPRNHRKGVACPSFASGRY